MKKTVNILMVNMAELENLVEVIQQEFKARDKITLASLSTVPDIPRAVETRGNAIVIIKINSKAEFTQTLKVLRKNAGLSANGFFKTICLLENNNQKASRMLAKYGCFDVLQISTNSKTILYKLDKWSKAYKSLWDKEADLKQYNTKRSGSSTKKIDELKIKENNEQVSDEEVNRELEQWLGGGVEKMFGIDLGKVKKEKEDLSLILTPPEINLESGQITLDLSQEKDGEAVHYLCQFKDLFDNCVWLTLSKGVEFLDVSFHLKLELEYDGKKVLIDDEVDLLCKEDYEENLDSIQFSLSAKSSEKISAFLDLAGNRQDSIDDFMLKARGR